jgi:hypothetical protein
MRSRLYAIVLLTVSMSPFTPSPALADGVHALFDLSNPQGGPFPSNRFTVHDLTQNTGLRVEVPKPDCAVRPSDCEDLDVINTLDGFNLQPRIPIPFGGPIDVGTVTSQTVFLVSIGVFILSLEKAPTEAAFDNALMSRL